MKTIDDLVSLGEHVETLLAFLPDLKRLGDVTLVEKEHKANIERLKTEERRLIDVHKTQARAELAGEADAIRARTAADTAKLLADAQAKVDAVDAEIRAKQKRLDEINGAIERGESKLAEYNRVRQSLAVG
jgi:hypothetical protein